MCTLSPLTFGWGNLTIVISQVTVTALHLESWWLGLGSGGSL